MAKKITLVSEDIIEALQVYAIEKHGLLSIPKIKLRFRVNTDGGHGTDSYELVADVEADK